MKTSLLSILSIGLFLALPIAVPVYAQDQNNTAEDEVIARATVQTDPAMSAWYAGDYATAEIEFKRNAFCALRAERNFISGVEGARDSSIRSDFSADAAASPLPISGPGGAGGPSTNAAASVSAVEASNLRNKKSSTKRTCEDRGYQLYMMGMSQLKLGKTEDAKATLIRAANMRKNLFDAHFRIALLEYQDGNIEKSNKHFKKLKKLQRKCINCEAEKEIKSQVEYLDKLL